MPDEQTSKIPKNMRYYPELYQVGVLVISLAQDRFDALVAGKLKRPINSEDADISEVYSAPFCKVQHRYQYGFLESTLGIESRRELDDQVQLAKRFLKTRLGNKAELIRAKDFWSPPLNIS